MPKQSGTATAYWLNTEATPIPETDATFGQISFVPRTVGVYSELSRLLNLQAPSVQDTITRDHGRLVGRAIDLAALYGTGINGQPLGLVNVPGVQSFSAASLSITSLIAAQTALGNALTATARIAATLLNAAQCASARSSPAAIEPCGLDPYSVEPAAAFQRVARRR